MKKVVLLIILFVLVFSVFPVHAESSFPLISAIEDAVNVRSGPGLSYKVKYQVPKGTILELLKKVSNNGDIWYKVYDFNKNSVVYIASWLTENSGVSIFGEDADFTAEVTADVLNVRSGPGTAFPVKDVLAEGDKVHITRIISRSDGQKWYRYKKNNEYFYIAGWYTKKVIPEKTDTDNQNATSEKIATALYYINIRKGPSLDYGKIGLVSKGDVVHIVGIAKNSSGELWIEVQYNGKTGWCFLPLFSVKAVPSIDYSPIGSEGRTSDYVNLRSGPSTSYAIQKVLPKDSNCTVVGVAKNDNNEIWYEVKSEQTGWIRSDLLHIVSTEKGNISKVTWKISPKGIDVLIYGESLRKPEISVLENPIRIDANFDNTILSCSSKALSINVRPIVRVRYEQKGTAVSVVVDLNDRIPFEGRFENGAFVLSLELPKKGEKRVELSNSEIYAPIVHYQGKAFIKISSIISIFNGKIVSNSGNIKVSFLDREISISKEDILSKDSEIYISLNALEKDFSVLVTETENVLYIDPVLVELNEKNGKYEFTFSLPPKVKKSENSYIIFADAGKFADKLNFKKRANTDPPEIHVNGNGKKVIVSNRVVTFEKSSISKGILSGRIIVIDPGHGSYSGPYLDTGATGPTGVKEGVVVLEIAKKLKKLLESDGAEVILTHTTLDDPNNPTLAQRCAIANNSGGDLFMSIHLNASVSPEAHGTETYYWHSDSLKFAEAVQNALVKELGTTDRGVKRDYLYVCRNVTTMPAILTEVVFVSNPKEEALCKQDEFLNKVAKALRDGIVSYLTGKSGG